MKSSTIYEGQKTDKENNRRTDRQIDKKEIYKTIKNQDHNDKKCKLYINMNRFIHI